MLKETFVPVVCKSEMIDQCNPGDPESSVTIQATGKSHGSYGGALLELEPMLRRFAGPNGDELPKNMYGQIEKHLTLWELGS